MKLKRYSATLLFAAALLIPGTVFGQEEEKKEGSSMENPGMEKWKWANFLLLAGGLFYLIRKNAGPAFAASNAEIRAGLEAGKKAKADADARAAKVQTKIANLGSDIATLRTNSEADLQREADRIRKSTEGELARLEMHTEAEIGSIGRLAQLEVRRWAAEQAVQLAEQKIRARMSPEADAILLHNFTAGLPNASGSNAGHAA